MERSYKLEFELDPELEKLIAENAEETADEILDIPDIRCVLTLPALSQVVLDPTVVLEEIDRLMHDPKASVYSLTVAQAKLMVMIVAVHGRMDCIHSRLLHYTPHKGGQGQ